MVGPLRGPMSLRSYGEAFFIFHSSLASPTLLTLGIAQARLALHSLTRKVLHFPDVRPLRGRLTAGHLSAGYARPAGLAHPRLSMVGPLRGPVVGPLRGPMSLRFYGEAFFILHS